MSDKLVKAPAPANYELFLVFALYVHPPTHPPTLLSYFSAPYGQIRALCSIVFIRSLLSASSIAETPAGYVIFVLEDNPLSKYI